MNKLLIIICLKILILGCSSINKYSSHENSIELANRNDNLFLNETEVTYLNSIFETTRKDFDFVNKKVVFIMISGENGKNHYFDMHKKHSINANYPCDNGTLYIFDDIQKKESGGYDAAIILEQETINNR